ncbi:ATP-binding protein [Sphingosinicella sp. BN140058]|uniref:ATP-binding protein n=1 Tax=Sphingosinicella sp. BN140058 TaxID=1892855 RepID=UPI001FB0D147|nr:ATP-binding protein [Sphingosinicella sp. BN140058]
MLLRRGHDRASFSRLLKNSSPGAVHEEASAGDRASVSRCLKDIERLLGPTIRVETEADPDVPSIGCDPFALLTALLNLASNARDALPGSGCVRIRVRALGLRTVEVSVADDGVGMSPETVQRAVDPYFTTKTCGLGGAGLPMVDGFVRQIGGEMIIQSELGVGTAVTLRLPAFDGA